MVIDQTSPKDISLYFHVPFCKKKCGYCHFFVVQDRKELHEQLIEGFLFELKSAKESLKGRTLKSIYFGGGTPSLLDPKDVGRILNAVSKLISISPQTEITMEFNPESTHRNMFSLLQKEGITRASIGIQSFDDELLKKLTREHSSHEAIASVTDAYESGIHNISIDLMYEIPHQTRQMWQNTLQTAMKLPISHLSLYNLTFEEGTAFMRKKKALALFLPSDEDAKEMYLEAISFFNAQGLNQYEISAFAKEGFHSCHNIGYWLGREFLGFGPSAFSYRQGKRYRNCENLKLYYDLTAESKTPVDFEEELEPESKIRELLAINLRLNAGVDLKMFQTRHGEMSKELFEALDELRRDGFLEYRQQGQQERVVLLEQGRLFFNDVGARLV